MGRRAVLPPPLLLLLLWTGTLCGTQEGPPWSDLTGVSGTLDLLWSNMGRIVRSAVERPIAGLDGRLTGVQVQVRGVRSELEDRVQNAETKLEARIESAETKLSTRVEGAESKLEARVQIAETKLDARVESAEANLEARLENAETKLDDRVQSAESKLEARVESAESKLEARVQSAESKLEARVENAESKLKARMNSIQSEQANQILNITGRLDQIESTLEMAQSHLESRLDRVQSHLESRLEGFESQRQPVRDCTDLPAGAQSGVHLVQPGLRQPVPVFCDQETDGGGWTVIQRRADITPRQDFFLGWEAYKWGFGQLDAEFWWGLQNMWLTTSLLDRQYQIRFDLEDFDGEKRFAVYQGFRVASEEDGYRLTAVNYTGNAGDSFGRHLGQRFTTKDRDQDIDATASCAKKYKGAWWYYNCHLSNLNGLYLSGNHSSYANGVNWLHWRGHRYSLKSVEMKIKPSKKPVSCS